MSLPGKRERRGVLTVNPRNVRVLTKNTRPTRLRTIRRQRSNLRRVSSVSTFQRNPISIRHHNSHTTLTINRVVIHKINQIRHLNTRHKRRVRRHKPLIIRDRRLAPRVHSGQTLLNSRHNISQFNSPIMFFNRHRLRRSLLTTRMVRRTNLNRPRFNNSALREHTMVTRFTGQFSNNQRSQYNSQCQ